jgi:hypothetical protein
MRHRSKTNSRKREDLVFREAYRAERPYCELWPLLKKSGLIEDNRYGCDIHHITGGLLGTPRYDLRCNLIHLSRGAHAWCERYVSDGLALCCVSKIDSGEFEPETFSRIMRVQFPGYFSILVPRFAVGVLAKERVEAWMAANGAAGPC